MEDEIDPLEAILSWGLGICLEPSNPGMFGFFLGGFIMRRVALPTRFVSLVNG